jgi:hypothetical protein
LLVRHPFWVRLCFTALIAPLGSLAFLCFLARVSLHRCCRRFENRLCSLDSSLPARLLQVLASSYLLACLFVCRLGGLCVWLSSNSLVCVCFSLSHSLCVSLCFLSSFSYDVTHELGVDITILIFCSDDIFSFINNLLNNVSISA